MQDQRIFLYCPEKALCQGIRNFHVSAIGEVSLHRMHHDIGASAGCLIIRQRHGQFRIHDCKFRAAEIAAVSAFHKSLFFGNHRGIAHLASRCRNRKNNSYRKTAFSLSLIVVEIPDISFVCHTVSDRFG